MSDHSAEGVRKHLKIYFAIGGALLVGTVLTVWAWTWHFDSVAVTVAVAMLIATVKATLVACFFMHLISERKAIYTILGATAFFFAALMYLLVWSRGEMPKGTAYFGDTLTELSVPAEVKTKVE